MRAGVLAAAAFLIGPACVTPGLQQVQNDLDAIQQQLFKVQKDSAGLAGQIEALRGALPPPGAGAAESPAQLKVRLEAIERDLSVLKSRADDSDHRVESMVQELQAARQEPLGAAPGASPGAAPQGAGPQAAAGTQPPAVPGAPAPAAPGAGGASPGAPAEDSYRLGELQLEQQKYPEAIASFDRVLEADPSGARAPGAYLKKGLALLELNRTAEAVIQLQHVLTAFPRSDEARAARDRLRGLGLKDR